MQITPTGVVYFTVMTSTFVLLFLIVFIYKILRLYNRRQLEYLMDLQLLNLEKEKEILSARIDVQEETFGIVAREIHDNINQILTLTKLNLNTVNFNSPSDFKNKISYSADLITEAIRGLTDISKSLNTDIIEEIGLLKILELEIDRIIKAKKINILLNHSGDVDEIIPATQLIIFRISQEAIRNSIMHGNAKNITINIFIQSNTLQFSIEDDGIGFNVNHHFSSTRNGSQGLTNIQKRLKIVGGRMEISSQLQIGTKLNIQIPIIN
jgi:two-component system NarL family sensor kinase